MYFRQYWKDERLQYNDTGYSKRLAFNPEMLKFIWVPDTHFPGIKDGLKHDITDTNEVVRLWSNGSVLYSMRWGSDFLPNLPAYNPPNVLARLPVNCQRTSRNLMFLCRTCAIHLDMLQL